MGKKDITLKDYLSDTKRYADLLNGSIFQGKQVIKASDLQNADTVRSKSDKQAVLERTNDITMKLTRNGNLFAVWIVENQENVDYSMPVRIMMQESLAYDKQLKEIKKNNSCQNTLPAQTTNPFKNSGEFLSKIKESDKLHPVISLIVYWGDEEWHGAKNLHDMIDFGEDESLAVALKALIPQYPLHFLNLAETHDYKAFHTELRTLFELYDKRNNKEQFQQYLKDYEKNNQMDEDTYWTLYMLTGIHKLKHHTSQTKEVDANMWKAIEDLIADGKTEGKIEGKIEALYELVQDGLLSIKDAAQKASMAEDVFCSEMKKAGY